MWPSLAALHKMARVKKNVKSRWWSRNGCDGPSMAKKIAKILCMCVCIIRVYACYCIFYLISAHVIVVILLLNLINHCKSSVLVGLFLLHIL